MKKNLRFVGLDVHKDTISIAVAESGREPARLLETIPADAWLLLKCSIVWVPSLAYGSAMRQVRPVMVWRGSSMNRAFAVWSWRLRWCPFKRIAGSRRIVATRSDWLTSCVQAIWWKFRFPGPNGSDARFRAGARRRDPSGARGTPAIRQVSLTSRPSLVGRRQMTHKHWQWIKVQEFAEEASRRVFNDYIHTVEQALARVQRLTADISELVERWTLGPLVRALQALRGVTWSRPWCWPPRSETLSASAHPSN